MGGGDDPIGFFMASYEMVISERKEMKLQISALKMDNDRLSALAGMDRFKEPVERDLAQEMYDLSNEIAREGGGC